MARSLLLQRSINHTNQPDPLVAENLIVDNDATIGDKLTVNGLTDIQVLNATSGVFTAAVNVQSFGVTDNVEIGGSINIDGNIESSNGDIILTNGDLNLTNGNINTGGDMTMAGIMSAGTFVNFSEANSGIRIVDPNTPTAIIDTDKILLISTTGAGGPFVITPSDLGINIFRLTIIMTAFNTAAYTFDCLQGTVTFDTVGAVASFIQYDGVWSLMGAPRGATVT